MFRTTTTSVLASSSRMLRQPLTASSSVTPFLARYRNAAAAASTARLFSISTSTSSPPPPPQYQRYSTTAKSTATQPRHPRVLVTGTLPFFQRLPDPFPLFCVCVCSWDGGVKMETRRRKKMRKAQPARGISQS